MPTHPRAPRVTAKAMRDALETIANYPLPVYLCRDMEPHRKMVPLDSADHLRTLATDALNPSAEET